MQAAGCPSRPFDTLSGLPAIPVVSAERQLPDRRRQHNWTSDAKLSDQHFLQDDLHRQCPLSLRQRSVAES